MFVTSVLEATDTPDACSIAAALALCKAINWHCSALTLTMAQEPSAEMFLTVSALETLADSKIIKVKMSLAILLTLPPLFTDK